MAKGMARDTNVLRHCLLQKNNNCAWDGWNSAFEIELVWNGRKNKKQ